MEVQAVREVYVDVAFGLNFATDLLWLLVTATLAGLPARWGRLLAAAALGAGLATWAYFPSGEWLAAWHGRLLGTAGLLGLAFWPLPFRQMARAAGCLVLSGAALVGAVTALDVWTGSAGTSVSGGLIVAGLLGCAAGGRYLWEAATERVRLSRGLWQLRISLGGRTVQVAALLDTGNSLKAPLSGTPVVVAEVGALQALLPAAMADAARAGWGALESLPAELAARCRPVPFRAVGQEEGVLLALAPDLLAVQAPGSMAFKPVKALVGLAGFSLHPDAAYQALLPAVFGRAGAAGPASSGSTWEGETR